MAKQQRQAVSAFIYDRRGRLLSSGTNSYVKSHTVQARAANKVGRPSCIYLHAEIAALVKIKDWSKAYKLVVMRYLKDGTPANAAPCSICQEAFRQTGIKIVQHT